MLISHETIARFDHVKTTDKHGLEQLTKQGWEIIAVFPETHPVTTVIGTDQNQYGNSYDRYTVTPINTNLFLVGMPKDRAEKTFAQRESEIEQDRVEQENQINATTRQLEESSLSLTSALDASRKLEVELNSVNNVLAQSRRDREGLKDDLERVLAEKNKLEDQLKTLALKKLTDR